MCLTRQLLCFAKVHANGLPGPCSRVDVFGQCVVATAPYAANRGLDAGLGKVVGVTDTHALPAAVQMMNQPAMDGTSLVYAPLEGVKDEAGTGRATDPKGPRYSRT